MENEKELRVLEAAKTVFLRYGFRRVTMQDVANEAGISRPALYLVFPNKEEVFKAAVRQIASQSISTIREGLGLRMSVREKLDFAIETWTVRHFELMLAWPDAKDLFYCAQNFAKDTIEQTSAEFEGLLTEILEPAVSASARIELSARQVSRLLAVSTHGFKEQAATTEDLRELISSLLTLTMASLGVTPRSELTSLGRSAEVFYSPGKG